jgi:predicted NUDIX family NTP pyrophosphohydrolase
MLTSAGLLLFRRRGRDTEVFLVHPGGPFWAKKDAGAWSIPKGLHEADEDPLAAARREFAEETGFAADGPFIPLGTFKISRDKILTAFAAEGDCAPAALVSNTFALEWPPKSGRHIDVPEVDRGDWFGGADALRKIIAGQQAVIRAFYEKVTPQKPARAVSPSPQTR